MPVRWKKDRRPLSRQDFEKKFPNENACADYLFRRRWPTGFVCPACGGAKAWPLKRGRAIWQCAQCSRQTSATSGTVMHRSRLPLKTWFLAAHIVASHSNGMSALQLQAQLGLGSYKTAWLLLHKLRRGMVNPSRTLLHDIVEVDETEMPFRRKLDTLDTDNVADAPAGKILIIGAVELTDKGRPRRIRLEQIPDRSKTVLHAFVDSNIEAGASVITDGWISYENLPNHFHLPQVVGKTKAHLLLTWIHRVFSNLKRWAKGVFHGFRRKHIRRFLDEFVFRWNRRHYYRTAFDRLLGIVSHLPPATYRDIVEHRA
jgi:hypothetical protein